LSVMRSLQCLPDKVAAFFCHKSIEYAASEI